MTKREHANFHNQVMKFVEEKLAEYKANTGNYYIVFGSAVTGRSELKLSEVCNCDAVELVECTLGINIQLVKSTAEKLRDN